MRKIKSIKNFRDLGGFENAGGAMIKPGMIFRCAGLANTSADDLSALGGEYNIGAVIDLRTETEAAEKPDRIPEGAVYRHYPVFSVPVKGISKENGSDAQTVIRTAPSREEMLRNMPDLAGAYISMISSPDCRAALSAAAKETMRTVCGGKGVIFHCTAGKDRTGILSAVLLTILGASRRDIIKNYLLTNRVFYRLAVKNIAWAIIFTHDKTLARNAGSMYLARREFINSAFDEAERSFGSFAGYIENGLGITEKESAAFRDVMLRKP